MSAKASQSARRPASGFTLVELMVALTVGGIAVSSIYAIGAAATRQFHTQQQVANAQTSLRMAINQLKRDIARAGYLSTPGAGLPGQSCAPPFTNLAAIGRFVNNVALDNSTNNNGNVDPTGNNAAIGASVDDITLLANYATANEYGGVRRVDDNTIAVSSNWYAFRHDFHDWYDPEDDPFVPAAFSRAFPDGRLIRIRTTSGLYHFATIDVNGVVAPSPGPPPSDTLIGFTPAIPGNCRGFVNGGWVAPVSAIRYFVQNAPANGSLDAQRNLTNPGAAVAAGLANPMAHLLRQEVQADMVTPFPGTQPRRIADYVVGFNLAFTMSTQSLPNAPDVYTIGTTTNNAGTVTANPERVRAVTIDLAVRTPEQDRGLPWSTEDTGCANLRCFQVTTQPGAARVRRMQAEVFLPNIAAEGY